jgi:hypothetical protein
VRTIADIATKFINSSKEAKLGNVRIISNQYVLYSTVIMTKHGNYETNGVMWLNWGGYYTTTTANHLNKILKAYGKRWGNHQRVSYANHRDQSIRGVRVTPRGIIELNPLVIHEEILPVNGQTLSPAANRALANCAW